MLATIWNERTDPAGWLMSEKYNGVRAIWTRGRLLTRNGNFICAPKWFTDSLPKITLDGELWMGRGTFQKMAGIVRRNSPGDSEWRKVRFMVIDSPWSEGGFEERLHVAAEALKGCSVAELVRQTVCADRAHFNLFYAELVGAGAEGAMLRASGSAYVPGPSCGLLKRKPAQDAEATVIAYRSGTGKYSGKCGSMLCEMGNVRFYVGAGLSDSDRDNPPAVGASITVSFSEMTNSGKPKNPVFVCERNYE